MIWNNKKANEALSELQAENKTLKEQLALMESNLKADTENDSEAVKAAEKLQGELNSERTKSKDFETQITTLKKERDDAKAEATAAAGKIYDFEGKVSAAASKEALRIVASQGAKPLKVEPSADPALTETKPSARTREGSISIYREQVAAFKKANNL